MDSIVSIPKLQAQSVLDQPLAVTFFPDQAAQSKREETLTLRQLKTRIEAARAPSKAQLEWLKLASFNDQRSPKGSLRHNANITRVTGVEIDCDDNETQPLEAVRRLRAAGVAAMVYTSPSHSLFRPRWRVLAPLAVPVATDQRKRLAGVLNAILGGVAARESFTASQSYYYGEVDGADDHHVTLTDGTPLDYVTGVEPVLPAYSEAKPIEIPARAPGSDGAGYARQVLDAAVRVFYEADAAGATHPTINRVAKAVASFVAGGWLDAETVCDVIREHMPRPANGGEVESAVDWAKDRAEPWTGGEEFEKLAPLPEPPAPARFTFGPAYVPRNPSAIPPREWLYGGHYIRQFITATVAPGGVGKSSLALIEALDMATGRGLLTGKPAPVKHRVIYWNGEDPLVETERRVAAACLHFGITAEELGDRLVIASGRDLPIVIARDTRDGCDIAKPLVEELIAEITGRGVDALILDPFVKSHAVSENDNNKIDAVASQWASIADRANCSIELIHHLRKASVQGQDRTAEDARGGVALIAAARSVRVLNRMGADEATKLGIADETRRRLFRVDDGKANLQPPRGTGDDATWRYQASVSLGNARPGLAEDRVGVVTAWIKPEAADVATPERVAEIVRRLHDGEPNRADAQSPMWVGHWAAGVLGMALADAGDKKRVGSVLANLVLRGVLKRAMAPDEKRTLKAVIVPAEPLPHLENEGCGKVRQGAAKQANQSPPTPPSMGCGGVVRQGGDSAAPYEGGVRQLEDAETNALAEELAALLEADAEATR